MRKMRTKAAEEALKLVNERFPAVKEAVDKVTNAHGEGDPKAYLQSLRDLAMRVVENIEAAKRWHRTV